MLQKKRNFYEIATFGKVFNSLSLPDVLVVNTARSVSVEGWMAYRKVQWVVVVGTWISL